MSLSSHTEPGRRRLGGPVAVAIVIAGGALLGALGIAPVRSQVLTLEAARTASAVSVDDPWAAVWDGAPSVEVPLSEQNLVLPFGGGAVDRVTVRAMYDESRLYLSMEWSDASREDAVNGVEQFSDAAALQFPSEIGATPPYTMGSAGQPVNIWQWKAVWQADIDSGFATSASRYPDTYVDLYPNADDPAFNTAEHVGNPLAQRTHASPVENLIAEGFGTLTSSEVQDVAGSGEWRDGAWRVVFARPLTTSADGLADFAEGRSTQAAFAVWDGASADRNGLKSIAQFIQLDVGQATDDGAPPTTDAPTAGPAPVSDDADIPWAVIALIVGVLIPLVAMVVVAARGKGSSA